MFASSRAYRRGLRACLVRRYQQLELNLEEKQRYFPPYPVGPAWLLIEDLQRQLMVYTNVIEQLKAGNDVRLVKEHLEELGLIIRGLPNPRGRNAMRKAFDKLNRYRRALFEIVKEPEGALRQELMDGPVVTTLIQVQIDLTPSVTLGFEFPG